MSIAEALLFSPLQLNAFDSRHLDEIYFDVRLTAFQDATRRVNSMSALDLDYIGALMHTCFHTYEVRTSPPKIHSLLLSLSITELRALFKLVL